MHCLAPSPQQWTHDYTVLQCDNFSQNYLVCTMFIVRIIWNTYMRSVGKYKMRCQRERDDYCPLSGTVTTLSPYTLHAWQSVSQCTYEIICGAWCTIARDTHNAGEISTSLWFLSLITPMGFHGAFRIPITQKGCTWKRSATMSQPAECGAAVVPQWYSSLPEHGVPQGAILSMDQSSK